MSIDSTAVCVRDVSRIPASSYKLLIKAQCRFWVNPGVRMALSAKRLSQKCQFVST